MTLYWAKPETTTCLAKVATTSSTQPKATIPFTAATAKIFLMPELATTISGVAKTTILYTPKLAMITSTAKAVTTHS